METPINTWTDLYHCALRRSKVLMCGIGDNNDLYTVGKCRTTEQDDTVVVYTATGAIYLSPRTLKEDGKWGVELLFTITELRDVR